MNLGLVCGKYIKGYVTIFVQGFFIEKFINLALQNNIDLWDIKNNDSTILIAKVKAGDYKKLRNIAKTTKCRIKIQKKVGMPFTINKYKKRKIFAMVFILIVMLICIYNSYIWNIEIVGDFSIPIEEIRENLQNQNLKIGTRKKDIDTDKIKLNIALSRNDISWIGINLKGTKAIVEVVQKATLEKVLDNEPCNIIADKEGIVSKISARMGTKVVREGDSVSVGQILISGIMSSKVSDDRFVHADGDIYIRTWYVGKAVVPYEKDLISKTGNVENRYGIKILNYEINLLNMGTKFEKYDKIEKVNRLNILGIWVLPLEVKKTIYEELSVDTINYTKEQAERIAKNDAMQIALSKVNDLNNIEDNYVNVTYNESSVMVELTIECIEKIGTKEKLEVY